MDKDNLATLLKEKGLRKTTGRLRVLEILSKEEKPIGIDHLAKKLPDINFVTLYRMMDDFKEAGIIDEYNVGHGHADYELSSRPHHHHAVCEDCGLIEDVYSCDAACGFQKEVLKASKSFKEIKTTQATFFGLCKKCA